MVIWYLLADKWIIEKKRWSDLRWIQSRGKPNKQSFYVTKNIVCTLLLYICKVAMVNGQYSKHYMSILISEYSLTR